MRVNRTGNVSVPDAEERPRPGQPQYDERKYLENVLVRHVEDVVMCRYHDFGRCSRTKQC